MRGSKKFWLTGLSVFFVSGKTEAAPKARLPTVQLPICVKAT